jgi:pimeloyl-ACP methyl ester carboxylesterase
MIDKAFSDIGSDLKNNPIEKDEQINLVGYSYGSVLLAHTAIKLAKNGQKIDNLFLIGSPISDKSDFFIQLKKYESDGKIGKILRFDIDGDFLSNPQNVFDYLYGFYQNSNTETGPHFNLARPDNPKTDKNEGADTKKFIHTLLEFLRSQGVKHKND